MTTSTMKTIAILLITLIASICFAGPLDQPAAKPVPTIRSEIKRGDEAVSLALGKLDELREIEDAFKALINDNRANHTDTDAFLLGAYYEYWKTVSIHAKAFKETNRARPTVNASYDTFREKQAALKLDDAALAEALLGIEPQYASEFIQMISHPFSILDK
jgi:hypothetical protein